MIDVTKSLIPPGWFALALSGGIDSIAAAHFLMQGRRSFTAIHVNAKYIKQDDECEERVRNFCQKFSIPLIVTPVSAVYKKGSIEAWCREQRYTSLQDVCLKQGFKKIVVCHHLDDCIESYLMNCFNGTPEYLPIPLSTNFGNLEAVRPFMLTSKKDFQKYITNKELQQYVTEDELNGNLKLKRNWIRHSLRPIIEYQYPGLNKVVKKIIKKKLVSL